MSRRNGPPIDPTTIGGVSQDPTEIGGGGGGLQELDAQSIRDEIESREFSDPNYSKPSDPQAVWDSMAGSGTEADPKIVTNDHELFAVSQDLTATYKLGANIDCSDTVGWSWNAINGGGEGFGPIAKTVGDTFTGDIRGDGHVIKGLYTSTSNETEAGLINEIDSVGDGTTIEDIIFYDCTSVNEVSRANAAVLSGNVSQAEAPTEENRTVFQDLLFIDCEAKAGAVGMTSSYLTIGSIVKRCGVIGCSVYLNSNTANNETSVSLGVLAGSLGGYSWGSNQEFNYSVISDIYLYGNEIAPDGNVPMLSRTGLIVQEISASGDMDTDGEYERVVRNVVIPETDSDHPLVGVIDSGSTTGDAPRLEQVYYDGVSDVYTNYDTGFDEATVIDTTTLTPDQFTGEDILSAAPALDFDTDWSTVIQVNDLNIYADGYPTLSTIETDAQVFGQDLGVPLKAGIKATSPTGRLYNLGEDLQTEEHPLRNVFPANTRLSSGYQQTYGLVSGLVDTGAENYSPPSVKDPQDSNIILTVGGNSATGVVVNGYNTASDEFIPDRYPQLGGNVSAISSSTTDLTDHGITTIGDYIIVAGGELGTGTDLDNIFYLDTSSAAPSWTQAGATLPTTLKGFPAVEAYGGEAYILGGTDGSGNATDTAVKFDLENPSSVSTLTPAPVTIEDTSSTFYDGQIYVAGLYGSSEDYGISDGAFIRYTPEDDSWERLNEVNVLLYSGDLVGSSGFGLGALFEYNGNIFYIDGWNWFDKQDVAVYDPEEGVWTGIEKPGINTGAATSSFNGAKTGVVFDGVVYFISTGNNQTSTAAYIPPKYPFDGE